MFTYVLSADFSGLEEMLSEENLERAQLILAEQVGVDCNEKVPKETGALRGSMEVHRDSVEWSATDGSGVSYAEYVYTMGERLGSVNWTEPGTGGDWLEKTSRERLKDWEKIVAEAVVERFV